LVAVSVVVITGAARGIGRASAERCLADGWQVVGVDVDEEALRETASNLGAEFIAVGGDISARLTHERAADAAESAGDLAGWVNNAGIEIDARAEDVRDEDLERTLAVNLAGTAYGCAVAVRRLRAARKPGSIVNVSSVHAVAAFPASFAYDASKGGIDALTRQVAVDYGAAGIRCNAVRPGAIDTPLSQRTASEAADPEAEWASYAEIHPLGRIGKAAEVAAVIAFLLGPDSSFITGACIAVDGGASARCFAYPTPPDLRSASEPP
jgi:NAD(P)-dependent dehydrogenase (short-subunit alcohol dehydrogenase family)